MSPSITGLIAALALALVLISIWRPTRTIFLLYAGTLPLASVVQVGVPLPAPFNTVSSLLGALAVVTGLAHLVLYRQGYVPSLPVGMWLAFLGWAVLPTLWALDPASADETGKLAAPLILLMVVAAALPWERREVEALRLAIILGGMIVGMYALVLVVSHGALPAHGVTERLSLQTNPQDTNPNILAASLVLPLALSLERFLVGGSEWLSMRVWRLLGLIGTFLVLVAIILTGSRGGLFSAAAVILLSLFYCSRVPTGRRIVAVAAATFGLTGILLFALGNSSTAPQGIVGSEIQRLLNREIGSSGRTEIWRVGLQQCPRHCMWGAGLGNFPDVYNEGVAISGIPENLGFNRTAHNIYLSLAIDTGVIGLMLFVAALLAEWKALSSPGPRSMAPALRAALVGLLVSNFFLDNIWFKYFWLVFIFMHAVESATGRRGYQRPP